MLNTSFTPEHAKNHSCTLMALIEQKIPHKLVMQEYYLKTTFHECPDSEYEWLYCLHQDFLHYHILSYIGLLFCLSCPIPVVGAATKSALKVITKRGLRLVYELV